MRLKMIEEAINKIKEEIKKGNKFIQTIGSYVLKNIEVNEAAAKGVNEGKLKLSNIANKITGVAKDKAINGCAIMSDEEVYNMVNEYFGFKNIQLKENPEENKQKVECRGKFNVNIEDLF